MSQTVAECVPNVVKHVQYLAAFDSSDPVYKCVVLLQMVSKFGEKCHRFFVNFCRSNEKCLYIHTCTPHVKPSYLVFLLLPLHLAFLLAILRGPEE